MRASIHTLRGKSPARYTRRPLSLKGANGASNGAHCYSITAAQFPPLVKGGQGGFTLVEIIVSIVAFGILMALMMSVFSPAVVRGTDPLFSMRAAELGQSYLEEILGKRFAENSPLGNMPKRCGETGGPGACTTPGRDAGENVRATNTFDDVDDYDALDAQPIDQSGAVRSGYENFRVAVAVATAGGDIGLAGGDAKRIDVTITDPRGGQYKFSAYKTNF